MDVSREDRLMADTKGQFLPENTLGQLLEMFDAPDIVLPFTVKTMTYKPMLVTLYRGNRGYVTMRDVEIYMEAIDKCTS
jgi:hypothetical protein